MTGNNVSYKIEFMAIFVQMAQDIYGEDFDLFQEECKKVWDYYFEQTQGHKRIS